jgi:hypothetical protein
LRAACEGRGERAGIGVERTGRVAGALGEGARFCVVAHEGSDVDFLVDAYLYRFARRKSFHIISHVDRKVE